jgi:hypothetical protein
MTEPQKILINALGSGLNDIQQIACKYNYPPKVLELARKQLCTMGIIEHVDGELTLIKE